MRKYQKLPHIGYKAYLAKGTNSSSTSCSHFLLSVGGRVGKGFYYKKQTKFASFMEHVKRIERRIRVSTVVIRYSKIIATLIIQTLFCHMSMTVDVHHLYVFSQCTNKVLHGPTHPNGAAYATYLLRP